MTMETLLGLCESYNDLGGAVQEQLRAVLDDADTIADQNPNALKIIQREFLRECVRSGDDELAADARDLIDAIEENAS